MLSSESRELAERLGALHRRLETVESVPGGLGRVAHLAVRTVPGCDHCGATLRRDGRLHTVANTPDITQLDHVQYELGEGPCFAALRQGTVHEIPSVGDEHRWPRYTAAAQQYGIGSVPSMPLTVDDEPIGVLNLYASAEVALTDDHDTAQLFARQAAVALDNARVHAETTALVEQLEEAMRRRAVIEQAKGIVMATSHVSADEAFALLRRTSQEANTKLRDVAQRVVDEATREL